MIEVESLSFRYPESEDAVLRDLSLDVDEGDLVLVCGGTGSGKSTLLRLCTGLVPRYSGGRASGGLRIGGRDVLGVPPRDLAGTVGFVAQDPEAHATADRVVPELAFAMENLGMPPTTMRKRVEEVLDQLGIGELRDRRLDTLSGGERQRVAIAAVLTLQPDVLVCDEPTSSLDPKAAEDVLSALVRLRDELGLTVLCSEHRLERVAGFCDRVVYLAADRTLAGDPREVFRHSPFAPPVAELGRALGWEPLPLTVRDGRRFARTVDADPPRPAAGTSGGEALLACRGLRVALDGREVLSGTDLELRAGEITALVGRNGSGKTTLLRCLVGLEDADDGRLFWRGRETRAKEVVRHVAYVPQRAETLLFRDTVADELHAVPGDGRWLERLGLEAVADRHPWTLSAGQRLWTALGTALARRPDAFLLDEPTRGLDPPGKARLAGLLREEADRGAAVLVVTHDVELVAGACDRVAMLAAGETVTDGPVREVLGESLLFSSQTSKVMADPRFLTPDDVLRGRRP